MNNLSQAQQHILQAIWPHGKFSAQGLQHWMPAAAQMVSPLKPEHPLLPLPGAVAIVRALWTVDGHFSHQGLKAFNDLMIQRNKSIEAEDADPLRYGYEPPNWILADALVGLITHEAFLAHPNVPERWKQSQPLIDAIRKRYSFVQVLGGNRSGKTEWLTKRATQCVVNHPNVNLWLLHQDANMSVEWHQTNVWKYLPPEWKTLGKGRGDDPTYISYTKKNGFSDSKFVGPTGSTMGFRTYQQFKDDPMSFEGSELGSPQRRPCIGYAADENLPLALQRTLRRALVTRASIAVQAFTPIDGYDETVAVTLDGAIDVHKEFADDLPNPRDVPLLQQSADGQTAILYFHSKHNPYGNYEELKRLYASEPDKEQAVRLYGIPHKSKASLFPRYNEDIHLFDGPPPEGTTLYHVADPAGARNWFMLWTAVDIYGRKWVYREWPCEEIEIPGVGHPGPWAVTGRGGTVIGPGAHEFGLRLTDVKNEIARAEGWYDLDQDISIEDCRETNGAREYISGRDLDSRFANASRQTASGNTTLLDECASIALYFTPTSAAGMTEGRSPIAEGVKLINNALGYEEGWNRAEDGPKLFIHRSCKNLRFALKTYTGSGGTAEPTKDPIDCLRYNLLRPVVYIDPNFRSRRRGPRGYGTSGGTASNAYDPKKKSNLLTQTKQRRHY